MIGISTKISLVSGALDLEDIAPECFTGRPYPKISLTLSRTFWLRDGFKYRIVDSMSE